jgi:predicted enzyme related to lactoylglutathione lyase
MQGIVHTEFAAADPPALAEFYKAVFKMETHPMDDSYIVWSLGEGDKKQGGGFRKFREGETQGPSARVLVYFAVEDITATLEQIKSLGGQEFEAKMSIGEHGFIGIFADPAGNTVGLWSKA